ncbi:hypothetical protein Vafri_7284 [Volvox africanus]|uniref:Uncharacterized protein n=1 Tax=Volvox africanus TaxID=51714 RepID=A0A8J4EXV1_9CHLO|nr:hypothetical protein Vafri_7284 [Volvox africanus]
MPWQDFSMSLPIASGMNLATRSFRSQLVASRVMISVIFLRIWRICESTKQEVMVEPLDGDISMHTQISTTSLSARSATGLGRLDNKAPAETQHQPQGYRQAVYLYKNRAAARV